jgi:type IV fimbrial biogenesis protein FimT
MSLFEALVTLAVVATLATVGIPSFREILLRSEQVTAVNTLITALHLARSEAIKRAMRVAICPSRDGQKCVGRVTGKTIWHSGYLLFVDQNGNRTRDGDETAVSYFGAVDRIRIFSGHEGEHVVVYQPNGFATLTNDTFQFCDPSGTLASRLLILSNTGRPRVAPGGKGCPADNG